MIREGGPPSVAIEGGQVTNGDREEVDLRSDTVRGEGRARVGEGSSTEVVQSGDPILNETDFPRARAGPLGVKIASTDNGGGDAKGTVAVGLQSAAQGAERVILSARRKISSEEAEVLVSELHRGHQGTAGDEGDVGSKTDGGGQEDGHPSGVAAPPRGGGLGVHDLSTLEISLPDSLVSVCPVSFLQENHGPSLEPGTDAGPFATGRVGRSVSERAEIPGHAWRDGAGRTGGGGQSSVRDVEEVSPGGGRWGVAPV